LGGKRFVARSVAWAITYLTLRTVLNSLRRLLASPLRALLALAIVGYLAYDEVSELLESSPDPETAQLLLGGLSAQEQVQGLVAIAVLLHGWFLVFRIAPAALSATRGVIQASDVDYLFATPLPPLRLFMGLALARASSGALSLLLPMAVYVLLVVEGAARETHLMRAPAGVALALLAYPLLCVAVYGAGLLWGVVLEDAELSGRSVRRWVAWGLWGWTAVCLALLVVRAGGLALAGTDLRAALGQAMDWQPLYALLLPVRGLADAAIARYVGVSPAVGYGFLLWLGALLIASGLLLWRRARLYEVCASLAQAHAAEQRAESDPHGAYLQARAERLANRRLRTPAGFTRWTPRSARALLWGEWLTAWRAHALGMALALFSMTLTPPLAAGLVPAIVRLAAVIEGDSAAGAGDWARLESRLARNPQAQRVAQRYAFVGAQAVSAVVAALVAYWGFVYALRRAAERKALPVPLRTQATMLALSPTLPFAGGQLAAALLACLWLPHDARFWLASSATAATGALALMTAMLTVALILPAASSTVQHMGRRWLMGVALTLSGVWGLIFWLLGALAPELLALACGANLLIALALTRWNGRLYTQHCPTN
jgi:hypothetical protein